jgi:hypothetical protein
MEKVDQIKSLTVIALAFIVLYLIFNNIILLIIAVVFLLIILKGGRLSEKVATGWMRFAVFLGNINSRIILTIVFYLILTPLGFFYRIFNRDACDSFFKKNDKSYLFDSECLPSKEFFERPW